MTVRKGIALLLGSCLVFGLVGNALAASFTAYGNENGQTASRAYAISADGSTVVGFDSTPQYSVYLGGYTTGLGSPMSWTPANGKNNAPIMPFPYYSNYGAHTYISGVSADGKVLAGSTSDLGGYYPFIANGGNVKVMSDQRLFSADSLSANGRVAVGYVDTWEAPEAVRWVDGGAPQGLGWLPGGSWSQAKAVSADGSVIVGFSDFTAGKQAFRWQNGTMQGLGDLAGGAFNSVAMAVSLDGSVIVGQGTSANGKEACIWRDGTIQGLGDLAGGAFDSVANGVSADGTVIVGQATSANGQEAFVWIEGLGMRSLKDILTQELGQDLSGWTLTTAVGISADGKKIAGNGVDPLGIPEAFVVDLTGLNLSPVPVPAAAWLLLGGLPLVMARRSGHCGKA